MLVYREACKVIYLGTETLDADAIHAVQVCMVFIIVSLVTVMLGDCAYSTDASAC